MMTVTHLRRPLRLRFAWRCQSIYLRWRIRQAERCRSHHERDLRHLKEDVDRMSYQIDWDDRYITSLAQRLGRVLAK
jgi:hypothetical protein